MHKLNLELPLIRTGKKTQKVALGESEAMKVVQGFLYFFNTLRKPACDLIFDKLAHNNLLTVRLKPNKIKNNKNPTKMLIHHPANYRIPQHLCLAG